MAPSERDNRRWRIALAVALVLLVLATCSCLLRMDATFRGSGTSIFG